MLSAAATSEKTPVLMKSRTPETVFRSFKPPMGKRYVVSVASIGIAFAIRYYLRQFLGAESPFMLFIAASLIASWYGGADAGILSLVLGLLLGDYFFILRSPPGISVSLKGFAIFRYLFTGSLGVALIELLHRGRRRLQAEMARREISEQELLRAQKELQRHADLLERRVKERTASLVDNVNFLEDFLYQIAHNLRAPVRAVGGYVSILMEEHGSELDSEAQRYCRFAHSASSRMDAMIRDLLDYGRLGHLKVLSNDVNLEQSVRRALAHLSFDIERRRANIEIKAPLPPVRADSSVLEEALIQLFENAIRFVPPGKMPHVQIFAERENDRVRVSIVDNGSGIAPCYHETIFRPFEVLFPEQNQGGTGMGLAIVRKALQRLGGEVGVESVVGRGSRFWLELPSARKGDA